MILRSMKPGVWLISLALAATLSSSTFAADESFDEAKTQFAAGSGHFQARRWAEALEAFERANAIVPSPNTELLIGRCLRELGLTVLAVKAFDRTVDDAKRRVEAGETKYAQAREAAAREGEAIRRTLGTIRVRIPRSAAPGGITLDGAPLSVDAEGAATVLSQPGTATIEFRDGGRPQRQTVTVLAGAAVDVEFAEGASRAPDVVGAAPPAPASSAGHESSWISWAAIGAGALAVGGGGVYLGFNAAARSTYDDLAAQCGPDRCTEAHRSDADRGERQQTIALVGLSIGAVAAAATVALVVVALGRAGSRIARVPPPQAMIVW